MIVSSLPALFPEKGLGYKPVLQAFFLAEWRMYDKRLMHEPSIRVPLMVRYPRQVKEEQS
jgi:hypothetical protein